MKARTILTIALAATVAFQAQAGGVKKSQRVVAAYVTPHPNSMPDPHYVTHINYAFGFVNMQTFDNVIIKRDAILKEMVALKKQNPKLKVILSIGGWASGGFSEMASDEGCRTRFIADCVKKCDEYGLDGIDIDWEYPGSSAAGIKSSPEDKDNFTLLMKGLREALGKKRVLTYASCADGAYADWKNVTQYLDFVNVMVYDMGRPPHHNAGLYKSEMVKYSAEEAIKAHLDAGVPEEKIVLGIPFYGHGAQKLGEPDYVGFNELPRYEKCEHRWDSVAMVPYIVNKEGQMIVAYDDEKSIKLKCEYSLKLGLRGVMYWEFRYDDGDQTLTKLTYNTFMEQ